MLCGDLLIDTQVSTDIFFYIIRYNVNENIEYIKISHVISNVWHTMYNIL